MAINVTSDTELDTAIQTANTIPQIIDLTGSFNFSIQMQPLQTDSTFNPRSSSSYTVDGHNFTLTHQNGVNLNSFNRLFFVKENGENIIQNLIIDGANATGGRGGGIYAFGPSALGGGGGGGLGAGGALFVDRNATVTLNNVTLQNCSAVGGASTIATNRVGVPSAINPASDSCSMGGGGMEGAPGKSAGSASPGKFDGSEGGGFLNGDQPKDSSGMGECGGAGFHTAATGDTPPFNGNGVGNEESGGGFGENYRGQGSDQFNSTFIEGSGGGGGDGGHGALRGSGGTSGANTFAGGSGSLDYTTAGTPGSGGDGNFGAGGGGGGGQQTAIAGSGGSGGNGGFGGGGGSGGHSPILFGNGGSGGFGGGGGSGGTGGIGGFSAGDGTSTHGGGGAGLGGAIFIRDGGTLNIQKAITFSGNSAVGGAGTTPGLGRGADIFMMSSGQITVDNLLIDSTIPNPIESDIGSGGGSTSTGGLNLNTGNTAKFKLNGTNTYTGTTIVSSGQLSIEGSLITPVDVQGTGTFGGNATLSVNDAVTNSGNLTVKNGGTVAPGGTIPVSVVTVENTPVSLVTVENNLLFESGSKFFDSTVTSSSETDCINVTGSTTIDPGARIEFAAVFGNFIYGQTITVLQAGSVTGEFTPENIPLNNQGDPLFEVQYTSTAVQLFFTSPNPLFTGQVVNPGNPLNVCNYILSLPSIDPNSPLGLAVEILGLLSNQYLNTALNLLHPAAFSALGWLNVANNSKALSSFSNHLLDLPCLPREIYSSELWIEPFGVWQKQNQMSQFRGFQSEGGGALFGYDYRFDRFGLGIGGGYTYTSFKWKESAGNGHIKQLYAGVYGGSITPFLNVDFSSMIGGNFNHVDRQIFFTGGTPKSTIDEIAKSSYTELQWSSRIGFVARLSSTSSFIKLVGNTEYYYLHQPHFKEQGAEGLNLKVQSKETQFIRTELGLNMSQMFIYNEGCFAPYINFFWIGKTPFGSSSYHSSFENQDLSFSVTTTSRWSNQFAPVIGFKTSRNDGLSFLGEGRAELGSKIKNYFGSLRIDYVY